MAPERVFDMGCGTGEFADLFAPEGYLGLDVHPATRASPRGSTRRHRFVCAAALSWPGDGRLFDLALTNGVLHHHDDATARALLRAALAQTRSGGWLVVIEDAHLPRRPFAAFVHAMDEGDYVRTPEAWMALVGGCAPIEHAESYVSGICPYHLMVARKA